MEKIVKTYIFLTNQYLPKPGATGLCVHQLAKQLASEGNEVYTVCYGTESMVDFYDGVNVVGVRPPMYLSEETFNSSLSKEIRKAVSRISKLVHITSYPLRSTALVHKYQHAVERIIKKKKTAKIIASYTPLEAVVAGMEIKRKYKESVEIVYYSTDTLSNEQGEDGILPASYRRKCGIRWEKQLFSVYDQIIVMECHKEHYFSETYKPYWEKMKTASFPLFSKMESCEITDKTSDAVSLVYAGTLYRVLRNPQFLCDCLVQLSREIKIEVDFLGGGDCDDILRDAAKASGGCIRMHGMESHETAMRYLNTSDVLLSIGNAESPMAPSKIYEYMSTGKPIIHVYSWEDDPCIQPLKKYGNALLIKEHATNAVSEISSFIESRRQLPFYEVEEKFITSTPQYTVNILE